MIVTRSESSDAKHLWAQNCCSPRMRKGPFAILTHLILLCHPTQRQPNGRVVACLTYGGYSWRWQLLAVICFCVHCEQVLDLKVGIVGQGAAGCAARGWFVTLRRLGQNGCWNLRIYECWRCARGAVYWVSYAPADIGAMADVGENCGFMEDVIEGGTCKRHPRNNRCVWAARDSRRSRWGCGICTTKRVRVSGLWCGPVVCLVRICFERTASLCRWRRGDCW